MFKVFRTKKGFTLVELMVVAVIVAILAAVAIPLMSGNKKRAYATEAESALGSVRTALRVELAEKGVYPTLGAGAVEGRVKGIDVGDLTGTFFSGPNFTITSAAAAYTVTCTWNVAANNAPRAAEVKTINATTTLNQDGTFTRTGY